MFIPSVPKDFNKLLFCIEQIKENVIGYDEIYVASPEPMPKEYRQDGVNYFTDKEAFNMEPYRFKWRHNWLYQMYMKMFQNVTKNEWYMTIDSDVMILKQLPFFENDKPIQWLGRDQNHQPYFKFQEEILGIGRIYNHSFINDMNFFSKKLTRYMIQSTGMNFKQFLEKSVAITNEDCHPGEPEMYGNYVYKNYPDLYVYKHMEIDFSGRKQDNLTDQRWTAEEIKRAINNYKNSHYHMIMLHSWT